MLDTSTPEVRFAIQAVLGSARLVHEIQRRTTKVALAKEDRSPVTVADFTAQAYVARLLELSFPQIPLVAEESTDALKSAAGGEILEQVTRHLDQAWGDVRRSDVYRWIEKGHASPTQCYWTLDPLDGTKGFLRGDQYAVALAYIEDQQVQIAVLGCPNLTLEVGNIRLDQGCLVIAMRGAGTWAASIEDVAGDYPLHVSEIDQPEKARILRSYESGHTNVDQIDRFIKAWGVAAPPMILDSQAKYALLAAGHGEVCLRLLSENQPLYKERLWDQAAGALIVEEAGGQISDLDGKPLDFSCGRFLTNNRGILATNGRLHLSALETLQRIAA